MAICGMPCATSHISSQLYLRIEHILPLYDNNPPDNLQEVILNLRNTDYDEADDITKNLWKIYVTQMLPRTQGMGNDAFWLDITGKASRLESIGFDDMFNNSDEAFALHVLKKKTAVAVKGLQKKKGAPKQSEGSMLSDAEFSVVHKKLSQQAKHYDKITKDKWHKVFDDAVQEQLRTGKWRLPNDKDAQDVDNEEIDEANEGLDMLVDQLDDEDLNKWLKLPEVESPTLPMQRGEIEGTAMVKM